MGDLVLFFTLKKFVSKLTKRGRGSCVISRLSSSGVVKLSTVDGKEMANWISGCRIKKYELPLTNEMLERMHEARNRKEAAALQRKEAQAEAKERI